MTRRRSSTAGAVLALGLGAAGFAGDEEECALPERVGGIVDQVERGVRDRPGEWPKDLFWVHGGQAPHRQIRDLDRRREFTVTGAAAVDWEDIADGILPGRRGEPPYRRHGEQQVRKDLDLPS
jgi:hypothetical protein